MDLGYWPVIPPGKVRIFRPDFQIKDLKAAAFS